MPLINRVTVRKPQLPSYTGEHTIYGDWKKGWIEMRTSGVLTLPNQKNVDIYLLGQGTDGKRGDSVSYNESPYSSGQGGDGGKYYEAFNVLLCGNYDVTIGDYIFGDAATTLGTYSSANGVRAALGGNGATAKRLSGDYTVTTSPGNGQNGRRPFANNTPMGYGLAAYALGAGGGGGALSYGGPSDDDPLVAVFHLDCNPANGGVYGGARGCNPNLARSPDATDNTGSGGGGGAGLRTIGVGGSAPGSSAGSHGGSGLSIVRWGY